MKSHHEKMNRYAIRKSKFGVASVAVASLFLWNGIFATAAEEATTTQPPTEQPTSESPKNETSETTTEQPASNEATNPSNTTTTEESTSEKDTAAPVVAAENTTTSEKTVLLQNTKTNNEMIAGKEFNGKYGIQLTVTGKDGQTYKTTYGGYSLVNIDQIDTTKPIQADFTIVNGDQDINANIILTLPNYSAGGNSSLVFDGSTVDKNTGIQLTSSLGQDYSSLMRYGNKNGEYEPLTQYTNKYSADAFNEQLRAVRLDGGQIKANDTLSFSLNLKLKESDPATTPTQSALFQIYNFINGHNGYVTDNLNFALIHQDAIGTRRLLNKVVYPAYLPEGAVAGGNKWVYASDLQDLMPTPDKLFRFGQVTNTSIPESGIQAEKQEDGYYLVKSNDASLGEFPNVSPYYFLLLPEVQEAIHTHGYTARPDLIPKGYYAYGGVPGGITIEGGADMATPRKNGAQVLHFQVIPSILLKEDQVHTVVASDATSTTWDKLSMVKQFSDPNKVEYIIAENDSRQLDKKDLTVTIYDITKGENNAVEVKEINLSKVGKYKVVYSHTFKDDKGNDLPISNTGYVTVKANNPVQPSITDSIEVKEQAPIKPQVLFIEDDTLEEGIMIVEQEGEDGYIETIYIITTVNGIQVSKTVKSTTHVEAKDHIVRIGTKKQPMLPEIPDQPATPQVPTAEKQLPHTGTTTSNMTTLASLIGLVSTVLGYTGLKKSKK